MGASSVPGRTKLMIRVQIEPTTPRAKIRVSKRPMRMGVIWRPPRVLDTSDRGSRDQRCPDLRGSASYRLPPGPLPPLGERPGGAEALAEATPGQVVHDVEVAVLEPQEGVAACEV